ncbi:MAG: hypothetical protein QOG58_2062 [Caballeronia sp.]|jgi:hypothetical protein|nr:hypothetical protein [Caballeronia sp.]
MLQGGAAFEWKYQEGCPAVGFIRPDYLKVSSDYRFLARAACFRPCNNRLKMHYGLRSVFLPSKRWGTVNRYASVSWRLLTNVVHMAIHKKCG